MNIKSNYLLSILTLSVASACSPHNFIEKASPQANIPAQYSTQDIKNTPEALQNPWWESFNRPALNSLILESLEKNQTVKQSYAVLLQAQATVGETNSDRLPQINFEGDLSKSWQGQDAQSSISNVGASMSWEIDAFNRIGSAVRADRFEARARKEDIETVKLALSAEVANAYFGAAASHRTHTLLKQQLKLDQDLLDLLELRLDNGIGTSVDVLRQKARVADSEKLIPLVEADLAVFENRIDVLLGQTPDSRNSVPPEETLNFENKMPPLNVPAALLLNRPDIRASQAELFAADAEIAVAISERLPQITLNATYAYNDAAAFSGPLSMIMSSFVQPLLDWGKRKAAVERNKAIYIEKLAEFTQNYILAVEEVENALIRENKQREFLKRLQSQRWTLQKTVNASEDRYKQGIDDYLPVIDALKELRQVQRDEIIEQLELVNIRIELFRALGGPLHNEMSEAKSDE